MLRYLRYLVLFFIALCLLTVAIANRTAVTVKALPDDVTAVLGYGWQMELPLFAVLYSILSGLVCHSLRRRGMPEETQAYYELDHVDERTHDILYNEAPARPAAGSADRPE